MHITSLAPELSATSRWLSVWIMSALRDSVGRARDDFDHAPVLGLGHRRDLYHADGVALAAGVLGVVGVQLAGTADVLAVQRVLDLALDQDRHGLVHLVADHAAFDRAQLLLGVLCHRRPSLLLRARVDLAEQRVDARDLAAHPAGVVGLVELARRLL